ncbi:MAG: hypothetical protein WCS99_19010 [Limisphaerales bacterium]
MAVALAFTTALASAQGQKGKQSQSSQQARQELDAAKEKLAAAGKDLGKAERELDKAEAAHLAAQAKTQKARQAAFAEHGRKDRLPGAIAQRDAALRAVDAAQVALTKGIRAQSDHQAAVKEAGKASARLLEVREDSSLSDEKKKDLASDLSKTIRRPAEMEHERIDADPNILELRAKAAEAGRQLASVQARAQKEAEEDSDVKAAVKTEADAADKVKTARAEVARHKKDVASAQGKVTTETQQYQKASKSSKKGK